ncbi:hypothetical protein JVW19_20035, partial [Vibrio cholerae O1]|nr:hypothetical protein [Vibrio cholerae O1]
GRLFSVYTKEAHLCITVTEIMFLKNLLTVTDREICEEFLYHIGVLLKIQFQKLKQGNKIKRKKRTF